MANTRLTVVVRRDLMMPEGLLAAQVCHIADAFLRSLVITNGPANPNEKAWCAEPYLSILAVECYEDLMEILEHAKREDLPIFEWHDLVPSPTIEGKSIKAFVGISIGPCDFDKIKVVTGALEPY